MTSIFSTDWWLESVSEGHSVGRVTTSGCSMPYLLNRHFGIGRLLMPRLTQAFSISRQDATPPHQSAQMMAKELKRLALRRLAIMTDMNIYMTAEEAEAFRQEGFAVTERVSYRIAAGENFEEVKKRFSENKRRNYRKGEKARLRLEKTMSVEDFFDFTRDNFRKRGSEIEYGRELACKVASEAIAHGQGIVLSAMTPTESTAAAILLVWDAETAYYLIPTFDPDLKQTCGMEWLTGESIRFALAKGLAFDFEGSMVPSYAKTYSSFGSSPRIYYNIRRKII